MDFKNNHSLTLNVMDFKNIVMISTTNFLFCTLTQQGTTSAT